eukprot:839717-Karenia_brevis.AAC.1
MGMSLLHFSTNNLKAMKVRDMGLSALVICQVKWITSMTTIRLITSSFMLRHAPSHCPQMKLP